MWIPVAFPNTMWMPVALPNDSNLRILRHIRAARATGGYPIQPAIGNTRIYAVFALPRVGQQEGIHSTIMSGSLHIYSVWPLSVWVSMVKSGPLSNETAAGNCDPSQLPRRLAVFDDFLRFDTFFTTQKEGHFMRQISR